ncbi:MAG: hypothetical protein WD053_08215 [Gracilimonas sp.]
MRSEGTLFNAMMDKQAKPHHSAQYNQEFDGRFSESRVMDVGRARLSTFGPGGPG